MRWDRDSLTAENGEGEFQSLVQLCCVAFEFILWRCVALGYVASHFVTLHRFSLHHNRIHCLPKMEMKNSDALAVLH